MTRMKYAEAWTPTIEARAWAKAAPGGAVTSQGKRQGTRRRNRGQPERRRRCTLPLSELSGAWRDLVV